VTRRTSSRRSIRPLASRRPVSIFPIREVASSCDSPKSEDAGHTPVAARHEVGPGQEAEAVSGARELLVRQPVLRPREEAPRDREQQNDAEQHGARENEDRGAQCRNFLRFLM
jgi:hypothetical protein